MVSSVQCNSTIDIVYRKTSITNSTQCNYIRSGFTYDNINDYMCTCFKNGGLPCVSIHDGHVR